MRAVIQRVTKARVSVDADSIGAIGQGLLVLLGIGATDTTKEAQILADKLVNLRIFTDTAGKFNLSALEVNGEILVVSQFTLYADSRKGRRPSFSEAARPEDAAPLISFFCERVKATGLTVQTGQFQAHMLVELTNDGPVTIILDTALLAN